MFEKCFPTAPSTPSSSNLVPYSTLARTPILADRTAIADGPMTRHVSSWASSSSIASALLDSSCTHHNPTHALKIPGKLAGVPLYGTANVGCLPAAKAADHHDGYAHTSPFQLKISLAELLTHQIQPSRRAVTGLDSVQGPW